MARSTKRINNLSGASATVLPVFSGTVLRPRLFETPYTATLSVVLVVCSATPENETNFLLFVCLFLIIG